MIPLAANSVDIEENVLVRNPKKSIPVVSPRGPHQTGIKSPLVLISENAKGAQPTLAQTNEASDKMLQTLVEVCPSNVAVLNEFGMVLYANEAWRAFREAYGLARDGTSTPCFDECTRLIVLKPNKRANPTLADDLRRLRAGSAKEIHGQYRYHGLTRPVHFAVHAARLDLPNSAFRILITHQDATSPAETLRTSEQRLGQLLEKTNIVIWEAEAGSWRFSYVSEQATRIFGYPPARWYEPDFLALHVHPDDRERVLSYSLMKSQAANQCDQYDLIFRLLAKDGRVVWVHNLVGVTQDNSGPKQLRGFMIDITELKCAEEALRDLGGRLITAQEEERSRVARELHDDLNQRMALLSIELEQLGQEVQKPLGLRRRFRALQTLAQEISTDLHRLSYKLHPSKLDHLGLGAAVNSLCEELSRNRQLKIEVRQKGFPATLPRDVTLCVFRIAQEALSNCLKHSSAQAAQVVLEKTASAIRLSVSDNGCGFDLSHSKKGLGFVSMRERIRLVRGEIHVYSRPQCGTRIEVWVPLQREGELETSLNPEVI